MKQKYLQRTKLAKGVALTVCLGSAANAVAGFQGHQPGPLMTLGKTSNPKTLLSLANNPAGAELLIAEDEDFRMGYWSSIGMGFELGDLDNVVKDVEDLEDILEDDNLGIEEATEAAERFNELLPKLGEDFNIAWDMGVHIPLFPMAIRSEWLGGVVSLDLSTSVLADIRFLDKPVEVSLADDGDYEVSTESALYFKAANLVTGTIGYGREVWQPPVMDSKLYAGVNINAYYATLNKQVVSFQAAADSDDDIGEIVSDELSENRVSTTSVGVDLGLLWKFSNAQAGLTITNINEPEFDYGGLGDDCSQYEGLREINCNATKAFTDEINLSEKAVLNAQTTISGSAYTKERMFLISGAYDLNSAYNLVGRESQMASAAVSYFPNSYFIPSLRLSAQRNLVGSELTTLGFGTTLFGVMNIDLAASLDTVEYDGQKLPRYIGFNIGFEEKF